MDDVVKNKKDRRENPTPYPDCFGSIEDYVSPENKKLEKIIELLTKLVELNTQLITLFYNR